MNNAKYATLDRKLPGGTEVIFNGKLAYVEHDRMDGFINLRPTKKKDDKEDNTFLISKSEIKLSHKVYKPIKAKKPTPEKVEDKAVLNAFFKVMAELVPFKCQNCGKMLFAVNKTSLRAVTCHILPKSQFPELAVDPDNIVFMGVYAFGSECDDHTIYDYSVEKRIKMPIYPAIIKRYNEKLRHKLSSKHQQNKADEYLGLVAKSMNLVNDLKQAI